MTASTVALFAQTYDDLLNKIQLTPAQIKRHLKDRLASRITRKDLAACFVALEALLVAQASRA